MFIEVAKCLGMKVHVKDGSYNIYKNIAEIREAVTDDPCCTKIHACLPCVSIVILLLYKVKHVFLAVSKIDVSVFLIPATSCFQGHKFPTGDKTTMLPCQGRLRKLRIIRPCAMSFTSKVYDGSLVSQVLESDFLISCH